MVGEVKDEHQKPKRNPSKTRKRPPRHDNPTAPTKAKYAWLPANHQHPQRLRRILWPQHNLSAAWTNGEERSSPKQLEHDHTKTPQNLPTNKPRKRTATRNPKLASYDLPKNKPRNHTKNPSIPPNTRITILGSPDNQGNGT